MPPMMMAEEAAVPSLMQEVRERRLARSAGLAGGAVLLGGTLCVGASANVFDGGALLAGAGMVASVATLVSASYNEGAAPLPDALFRVGPSDDSKGDGLFACKPIAKGTFLFDYEGERLTEEEFFARYPDANGRYVACIDAPLPWMAPSYIDGANVDLSSIARWINHSCRRANVRWKKQRFGTAMHFYAMRDIAQGEELFFDYGDAYWKALGVEPIDD